MTDVGKLTLSVIHDGASVREVSIRSTRPTAAQLLIGKTPAQVLQVVPQLFSVCGRAQTAAAGAAMDAAMQTSVPASATMVRSLMCEAMQEHLWRLMLDWPKALGLAQQEQAFAKWYAMLRKISAGGIGFEVFQNEFGRDYLGMPIDDWRDIDGCQALQAWTHHAHSPAARLLARLSEMEQGRPAGNIKSLPAWTAVDAALACSGRWGGAFAARPDWQGTAAETGVGSYYSDDPLLRDVVQQGWPRAMTRVLARILDVVEMASGNPQPRLDAASPSAGEGVAVVRTARGLLIHQVRIAEERVADYSIIAPTEWNFHPAGAFTQALLGLHERDGERLNQLAQIEALSLDPCVPYEIEVCHA